MPLDEMDEARLRRWAATMAAVKNELAWRRIVQSLEETIREMEPIRVWLRTLTGMERKEDPR